MNQTLRTDEPKTTNVADDLVRPLFHTSVWFYAIVLVAGTIVACGAARGATSLVRHRRHRQALAGVLGLYLTNFVFWIGISHAGTLISAILRLVNADVAPAGHAMRRGHHGVRADDRRDVPDHSPGPAVARVLVVPVSERARDLAELPLAAGVGLLRDQHVSHWQRPVPVPADDSRLRAIRDRSTGWRRKVYGTLAFGWRGTTKQWHRLESAMQIMAIAILPVAVSVHTIVSFDFSMADVPMWHSTIFGPYFVAGAIFSGIAALIIAMAVIRKALAPRGIPAAAPLREPRQTPAADEPAVGLLRVQRAPHGLVRQQPHEMAVFWATQRGDYAPFYWAMVIVQFRRAARDLVQSEDADHSRHRHRLLRRRRSACGSSDS